MKKTRIDFGDERIRDFARKWRITELALFGSVLRDDFNSSSDVDVLVAFEDHAKWSLFDLIDMRDELQTILGREVDLIEKRSLRNPFRRSEILRTRKVIYAA
ncbi:MAG: nucleotidyltransferase domain-containing protein [Candidatus Eisenbacteria bacterium]|uniref:Nucleotidyltransferase domain-containing protein n=1 Tax=Eiseniibacteriota bacterium TaxID=2212470 RepID=A0A948W5T3_UNCEI|nr:nucleotidyltransferase domain-containing protein [Candidatus Eisenbacteria bacterium]MBU1950457.1 nucleotidyltransferase domain-containing protein [Candidatus Eisenbacteria bacterium]MBU2690774.1 nucleotidyltransferase domain-containing protein [Candidatus Eisenbacteria bacterium]